jgi:hypothetical protein
LSYFNDIRPLTTALQGFHEHSSAIDEIRSCKRATQEAVGHALVGAGALGWFGVVGKEFIAHYITEVPAMVIISLLVTGVVEATRRIIKVILQAIPDSANHAMAIVMVLVVMMLLI